jgi:hypothetical protein
MESGKVIELKISILHAIHFTTTTTWQQVTQSTNVNGFCQCGYGRECIKHAELESIEEEDEEDWIWFGTKQDVNFSSYASVDSEFATCGVSSMDELCIDGKGGRSSKEEVGGKCEPEPVPSLNKVHAAFKTSVLFFSENDTDKHDEENILNIELALLHLKHNVLTTHLKITDLFVK